MSFRMIHENYNVSDLDRSGLSFMAMRLICTRSDEKPPIDFIIVYLTMIQAILNLSLLYLKNIRTCTIWVTRNFICI